MKQNMLKQNKLFADMHT